MNNFIHCNKCSAAFKPQLQFFLTTCGHILCQQCSGKIGLAQQCLVCSNQTSVVLICEEMPKEYKDYFVPTHKRIQMEINIENFQTLQRQNLIKFLQKKYDYFKKSCAQLSQSYGILQQDYLKLRTIVKSHTTMLKFTPGKTSTPNSSQIDRESVRFNRNTPLGTPGFAQRLHNLTNKPSPMINHRPIVHRFIQGEQGNKRKIFK